MTPLSYAASEGHAGTVRILIDAEADVNAKSHHTMHTALHLASKYGHADVVEILVGANADVSATATVCPTSEVAYTPLATAVEFCHPAVVKVLLQAGGRFEEETALPRGTALDYVKDIATMDVLLGDWNARIPDENITKAAINSLERFCEKGCRRLAENLLNWMKSHLQRDVWLPRETKVNSMPAD